jgi:hypothetical protein
VVGADVHDTPDYQEGVSGHLAPVVAFALVARYAVIQIEPEVRDAKGDTPSVLEATMPVSPDLVKHHTRRS